MSEDNGGSEESEEIVKFACWRMKQGQEKEGVEQVAVWCQVTGWV